jgi:hypothetical protein
MLRIVRIALLAELCLTVAKEALPAQTSFLPLCGSPLAELGVVFVVTAVLLEILDMLHAFAEWIRALRQAHADRKVEEKAKREEKPKKLPEAAAEPLVDDAAAAEGP